MKKVYVKEEVCIGCHLCEVYCQLQHSQSKDLIKALKRESPRPLSRIQVEGRGPISLSVPCQQCDEAPCVYACLTGALTREPMTRMIKVDEERRIGCWTCLLVCPFGAIKPDMKQRKMVKCDLCPEEDIPVCVTNCPNEALVYTEIKDEVPSINTQQVAPK